MGHKMNSDAYSGRYIPTSPLSPRITSEHRPLSPAPASRYGSVQQGRQAARNMHMNLPRFHPANFTNLDSPATPSSTVQSPAITINRVTQPLQLESPRLMREKQREFLERAHLSSKIAASSMGVKPSGPRLDPLGSPKGPVTPLALEEGGDYFQVGKKASPAGSPGARSPKSDTSSDRDEGQRKKKDQTD